MGRKMPRFRALGRKKERLGLGPRSKFKFTEHPRSSGGRIQLPFQAGDLLLSLLQPGLPSPCASFFFASCSFFSLSRFFSRVSAEVFAESLSLRSRSRRVYSVSWNSLRLLPRTSRHPAHDIVNFNEPLGHLEPLLHGATLPLAGLRGLRQSGACSLHVARVLVHECLRGSSNYNQPKA